MTEIRPLTRQDVPRVFPLWAKTFPDKYRVTESSFAEKTVLHPNFLPQFSYFIESNGIPTAFVILKADPVGTLFGKPNLDRLHLNSLGYTHEPDIHLLLLDTLCDLRDRIIVFGQDQGHFFPGVPEECRSVFSILGDHGFKPEGHLHNDLEHDLREFTADPGWLEPLQQPGISTRPCTPEDIPALEEFFLREFPGRWHYDAVVEKCKAWEEPEGILALWKNESIEGFAYTQTLLTTEHPTAGFVWHLDLGQNAGALGPIGVSKRVRGQKLGGALLVAGLQHLKNLGTQKCIIDWTSLVDFYGKYGFQVNRRYQSMTKPAKSD